MGPSAPATVLRQRTGEGTAGEDSTGTEPGGPLALLQQGLDALVSPQGLPEPLFGFKV